MKQLVVYYSLEEHTDYVAKIIADIVGADLLRLIPIKEVPKKGFRKYLEGGKQAFLKETPKLMPKPYNIDQYDMVYIGTPVWAGTFSPCTNTFLHEHIIKNKKVALFCCYRGSEGKCLKNMKRYLKQNTIIGSIGIKEPVDNDEQKIRIQTWAQNMNREASL